MRFSFFDGPSVWARVQYVRMRQGRWLRAFRSGMAVMFVLCLFLGGCSVRGEAMSIDDVHKLSMGDMIYVLLWNGRYGRDECVLRYRGQNEVWLLGENIKVRKEDVIILRNVSPEAGLNP